MNFTLDEDTWLIINGESQRGKDSSLFSYLFTIFAFVDAWSINNALSAVCSLYDCEE